MTGFEFILTPGAIKALELIIALIIGLAIRDIANSLVSGLLFKLDKEFQEGQIVYINGERATIISIGLRQTKFEINNDRGKLWKFVPNERIRFMELEKIIIDNKKKEE